MSRSSHVLNLHQFARDGVTLLGRITNATDHTIALAPDLKENLAKSDEAEAILCKMVDGYIAQKRLDAPREELPQLRDGYSAPEILELDLKAAGITTIIWAMGYSFDFSLVRLPTFDADGFPVRQPGMTNHAGLYFRDAVAAAPENRIAARRGRGRRAHFHAHRSAVRATAA